MRTFILIFLILITISLFCCYTYLTIYKLEVNTAIQKKNVDLLNEKDFNLDKMNPNRWNYGRPDFAPYIDGSYKQVTNNYVPGFKFNQNIGNTTTSDKTLHNVKINAWRNRSDDTKFLVQCS
tara:strand:+ start:1937 stop:2302 length:366 start_codon:yes stop_codon:yes gene_type:complete